MTNEEITEEIEKSNIKKLSKFNLQQIANFIDFTAPSKEANDYFSSLVYLILQDLENNRVSK